MRVAAIDIGTNTVLLLVAERTASGALRAIAEHATITRLGEGVDRARALAASAVERTERCLEEYACVVSRSAVDRIAIVGTSAMRDASGGEALRDCVVRLFGTEPKVLDGADEARLSFSGALSALPVRFDPGRSLGMFDIGGGSTEVVIGRLDEGVPALSFAASFDIGSVRLTERFRPSDPPSPAELDAVRTAARSFFREVPALPEDLAPIGVAGTMTTLAAVYLGLTPYDGTRVHGLTIGVRSLASTVDRLAAVDNKTRTALPGMEPKRSDVIVAGGIVALALLEHWRAAEVVISDRGVRWGLAEELSRMP